MNCIYYIVCIYLERMVKGRIQQYVPKSSMTDLDNTVATYCGLIPLSLSLYLYRKITYILPGLVYNMNDSSFVHRCYVGPCYKCLVSIRIVDMLIDSRVMRLSIGTGSHVLYAHITTIYIILLFNKPVCRHKCRKPFDPYV